MEAVNRQRWFDLTVPFVDHLGIDLLEKLDGRSRLRMEAKPEFENNWGGLHGGVLLTLLDVALATAARSLDATCNGALTVELKANFIAAAKGPVLAEGHATRAGRSLIFSEGELRSEAGVLLAKATGTFKLLYAKEA